jgi:membrane protein required for colicin V production
MSAADLVIALVVLLAAALGYYWGLLRQILALAGLLVGLLAARRLGPTVAGWLSSFTSDERLASVLGFGLTLLAISALSSLIATALRLRVGLLFWGWLDHALGAGLGLLKSLLGCALLLALIAALGNGGGVERLLNSRLGAALAAAGALLIGPLAEPQLGAWAEQSGLLAAWRALHGA